MKILFFNNLYPSLSFPKRAAYAATIAKMLEKNNEVDLCVRYASKYKVLSYIKFYIELFLIGLKKYDLLYINHYTFLIPLIIRLFLYKKQSNLKIIFHWHGEELMNESFLFRILRLLMKRTFTEHSYHVSPSLYYEKVIHDKFAIPREKIFISPSGGVDTSIFTETKQKNTDELHLGFPAALNEHKGLIYLMNLFKNKSEIEKKIGKSVFFHIIAYGEKLGWVMQWIKEKKCNFVIVHESFLRQDLHDFYAQVHITLFLSKRESLGLTVLESMSCGVPVIARGNSSMKELIVPGLNGEVVSNQPSNEELINMISQVYQNLYFYKPRRFVLQYYDAKKVQENFNQFIESI